MALRLRRGTDAERLLITPLQGELIYTIDTKQLYAGDGTTAGGTLVSAEAPTSLDSLTDTDLTGKTDGQVLSWNSGSGNWEPTTIVGNIDDGVVEGSNYRLNIVSDDSTILVNSATSEFTGSLTGNVTGNVIGTLDGDVTGSVFADDSTLIIDGITGKINASSGIVLSGALESIGLGPLTIESPNPGQTLSVNGITGGTFGTEASLTIDGSKGSLDSPQDTGVDDIFGAIKVRGYNSGNHIVGSIQQTSWATGANFTEIHPKSNWRLLVNAGDGNGIQGTGFSYMDLTSNGVLEGPIFKMKIFATTTARDAEITAPETGMTVFVTDGDGAGNPKFQGYDGSAWVNLN